MKHLPVAVELNGFRYCATYTKEGGWRYTRTDMGLGTRAHGKAEDVEDFWPMQTENGFPEEVLQVLRSVASSQCTLY